MPMPPPKPSTEGPRDRQVFHEMGQIVRAIEANGPQTRESLHQLARGGVLGGGPVRPGPRARGRPTDSSRRGRPKGYST